MDRGAWQAAVHGVAKSWTRLSDFTFTFFLSFAHSCYVWISGLGFSTQSTPILGSAGACGGSFPDKQSMSTPSLGCSHPRWGCPWRGPVRETWVPALPSVFQAGLASPENSEQLIIALEPEAASIYCRKLRLHQMTDLSSKAAVNGYSSSDTVGAGFAQGTCSLSPLPATPLRHPACVSASEFAKALSAVGRPQDASGGGWT